MVFKISFFLEFINLPGECWSGPEAGETYNKLGFARESRCVTSAYKPCPKNPKATDKECVGKNFVNYIYGIENNKGNTTVDPAWHALVMREYYIFISLNDRL